MKLLKKNISNGNIGAEYTVLKKKEGYEQVESESFSQVMMLWEYI